MDDCILSPILELVEDPEMEEDQQDQKSSGPSNVSFRRGKTPTHEGARAEEEQDQDTVDAWGKSLFEIAPESCW